MTGLNLRGEKHRPDRYVLLAGVGFFEEETVITTAKRNRQNDEITAHKVRLINADGENVGIVALAAAKSAASEAGLDLVEISPMAEPPVWSRSKK